jgi:hypothetical protein
MSKRLRKELVDLVEVDEWAGIEIGRQHYDINVHVEDGEIRMAIYATSPHAGYRSRQSTNLQTDGNNYLSFVEGGHVNE